MANATASANAATTPTSRVWQDGRVIEQNIALADLSEYLHRPGTVVWVDLADADEAAITAVAAELGITDTVVEDALALHERPKFYRFAEFMFVTAYAVAVDTSAGHLKLARVSAFVTDTALVTIRRDGAFELAPLVRRWDETATLIARGVGGLLHGLLDVIVDGHFDAVQRLDDAIEGLEDGLFQERPQDRQTQRRAYLLRKSLVRLRRVVLPMREVVSALQRAKIDEDDVLQPYYADLADHVVHVTESTDSLRDLISTIFETNLSLADTRLNTIMKKLTSWAAIIAVPTAITGFYGQNLPFPGFDQTIGFVVSSALIVGVGLLLYVLFRRRDWL